MKQHEVSHNNFGDEDVFEWGTILTKGRELTIAVKQGSIIHKLTEEIAQLLNNRILKRPNYSGNQEKWFGEGMPCNILKPGTPGWQKGKVKLQVEVKMIVEFVPDEPEIEKPESPLDEFRQK